MRTATLLFLITMAALPAGDEAVPAPVSPDQFSVLFERPPFRRVLGLPDSLVLSGVAALPAGDMVTVWNRATKESFMVTATPNAQGWKLLELKGSADLKSVAAVIASGDQTITLRFDPERLTPPKLDNTSRPAGRTESEIVVEALLRALDPGAAKTFESLPPASQEDFRKSFAGFLGTYPAATDPQRLNFVRRTLAGAAAPSPGAPPPAPGPAPAAPVNPPAPTAPPEE